MRPTFDQLREENDPGCMERERLEREAPQMRARIADLVAALRGLVHACTRYDECPTSVEMAEYASAKALAEKALCETVNT